MSRNNSPRLLIAAPNSGGGKTTAVCAILKAFSNRGKRLSAFKCGPDYIDPMFHTKVLKTPCGNLDLFFFSEDIVRFLVKQRAEQADLTVMEGVMGFYDGLGFSDRSSSYHLARSTATPVILVVNGRGMSLSSAAFIKGFLEFRADSGIRGVILNRVSPRAYTLLKSCIEENTGVPVLGYLPELPEITIESRHLGLVTAGEIVGLQQKLERLAQQAEQTIDLDACLRIAESAPCLHAQVPNLTIASRVFSPKIAVAWDEAFCFYYRDSLALLERLGARLEKFSPLHDRALPPQTCGLLLGGGYPELYAQALSENREMRQEIGRAVLDGMPCIAECGGFLYLHHRLQGMDGQWYPMADVIPASAQKGERLQRFGYVTLTAKQDGLFLKKGDQMPAHEFHYWQSDACGGDFRAEKSGTDSAWNTGYAGETLYAGFPHFHFYSNPQYALRFVRKCAEFGGNHHAITGNS